MLNNIEQLYFENDEGTLTLKNDVSALTTFHVPVFSVVTKELGDVRKFISAGEKPIVNLEI